MDMMYLDTEQMRVLVLDTKHYVLANLTLYQGTINSAVLRTAEIFRPAITRKAPSIVVCHNHPSGDPLPSPEDEDVTTQLVAAGKVLEIEVLDHIIIGNPGSVSLRERMNW
jgi:DNA repair protein RadC